MSFTDVQPIRQRLVTNAAFVSRHAIGNKFNVVFFSILMDSWLVGSTHLKNMIVKLDHFPRDRGENSKNI